MTSMESYLKFLQTKMPETGDEDYSQCFDEEIPFTIEISIPMRKPEGHFSRAPGVVLEILSSNKGGTFFKGQGYWNGVQEPVIYLMISTIGTPRDVLSRIKGNLETIQMKLKQQEVFLKLNGESFVGSVISEELVNKFPKQWKFDDDLRAITANQTRRDEHYKIIFGRVAQDNKKYDEALNLFRDVVRELNQKKPLLEGSYERRDLLVCCINMLGIGTRKNMLDKADPDEISNLIGIMNQILPFNQESEFEPEVLSPHAEARMRGNRLQLSYRLKTQISDDDELVKDGIFALRMLESHLKTEGHPYLEQDPVADIITIKKYLKMISGSELQEVTDIVNSIAEHNSFYSDELLR